MKSNSENLICPSCKVAPVFQPKSGLFNCEVICSDMGHWIGDRKDCIQRFVDLAEGKDKTATGCFIKGKYLENSIMTPEEHEQAKQGNCPSCSGALKSSSKNEDMTIKHCEPCNKFYII